MILAGVGLTRLGDVFFKAYTVVSLLLDLSLQKIISSAIYFPSAPVSSIFFGGTATLLVNDSCSRFLIDLEDGVLPVMVDGVYFLTKVVYYCDSDVLL